MDPINSAAQTRGFATERLENYIIESYRSNNDGEASAIITKSFANLGKEHLLTLNVGRTERPLMRIFSGVSTDEARIVANDFPEYDLVPSNTWCTKQGFTDILKEASFRYSVDYCRKFTNRYISISSEFRSKVFNAYNVHLCADMRDTNVAVSMMSHLEFMKSFVYPKKDYYIRKGLNSFLNYDKKLNPEKICNHPASCNYEADTIIVDHIENYLPLEQVIYLMEQHGSARAIGYFLFPDCIDVMKKGDFYNGNLRYDRSREEYDGIKNPVLFYSNNGIVNAVYPYEEYKKLYATSLLVYNGICYRKEIVSRNDGTMFYLITKDGDYSASYIPSTHKIIHRNRQYKCVSYRPKTLLDIKRVEDFEEVECFVPEETMDKAYAFGMNLGDKDFKKEIKSRFCAAFMRVQNAATGAVTMFDPGLNAVDVDIATDALWATCFFDRHLRTEMVSHQINLLKQIGSSRFDLKTLIKFIGNCVDDINPLSKLLRWFDEKEFEKRFESNSLLVPRYESIGAYSIYGGLENMINIDEKIDFDRFNIRFVRTWFAKIWYKKKPEVRDNMFKKLMDKFMYMNDNHDSECPYYSYVVRNVHVEDRISFYTEEIIPLHDEVELMDGTRGALLNKLNLVTDTYEPVLTEVPIYKEHSYIPVHQEPVEKDPLDDLEEVIPSIRMAIEMVERDAPPLLNTWYDLYHNHYNDVSYEIPGGVTFNTSSRKPLNPSSVMLPVVKSYVSRINNPPSYKNTLTAMVKRNFNVPALEEITSSYENVLYSVTNMFNCCLKPGWRVAFEKYYHTYSIHNFFDTNKAYVNQLAPGKAARFNLDEMLPYWLTNKNIFKEHTNMLKSKAKFPLKGEIKSEYTINATINYHKPEVNCISSSIFRNIITRLKVYMRDNCVMMIEKDRASFEELFFSNFEKKKYIKIGKRKISLEIDYSKFDKSQIERCAMIEMFIYSMLGLDKEFLIYWYESLEESSVYNYHDLIKAFYYLIYHLVPLSIIL